MGLAQAGTSNQGRRGRAARPDPIAQTTSATPYNMSGSSSASVRRVVAVLCCDRSSSEVDRTRIRSHVTAVVEIPYDPHPAAGGQVALAQLRPATRDATYELAGLMADQFR